MALMVSISGIRGIVGQDLTPDTVGSYACAFVEYCRLNSPESRSIVVGRDGRVTGEMLTDLVVGNLTAMGMDVRLLGICPTPTVQLAVEHEHAAGGIAVTASHNPMEWNGMKFVASSGMFLIGEENKAFWGMTDHAFTFAPWRQVGTIVHDATLLQKHIDEVLRLPFIDPRKIARRKFKVVLDCINAAGGMIVPALLQEFGCQVISMNCEVSGVFARTPEPIPENLTAVAERVRVEQADLGIVVDPDVDRLVLIDEHGEPFGEENTIATAVQFMLGHESQNPRTHSSPLSVVVNLSTTRAVDDIATTYGARCIRTAVGEINVARRMKEECAIIGGEGSGGVILPAVHLGRDAIVGIALILEHLTESGKSLSAIKAALPQYSIAKGKTAVGSLSPEVVLKTLESKSAGKARVNREDGIKFDFPDYWIHLRKSNTEPIIRVLAEAPTAEQAGSIVDSVLKEIQAISR